MPIKYIASKKRCRNIRDNKYCHHVISSSSWKHHRYEYIVHNIFIIYLLNEILFALKNIVYIELNEWFVLSVTNVPNISNVVILQNVSSDKCRQIYHV